MIYGICEGGQKAQRKGFLSRAWDFIKDEARDSLIAAAVCGVVLGKVCQFAASAIRGGRKAAGTTYRVAKNWAARKISSRACRKSR